MHLIIPEGLHEHAVHPVVVLLVMLAVLALQRSHARDVLSTCNLQLHCPPTC